jgi:nicotinamide riboside transporter PnuC
MDDTTLKEVLQIAGWALTVVGQIQVALKLRQGFITWLVANFVMVALCVSLQLWWSIGMYLTNIAVCVWSFRKWTRDEPSMRPLFVKRAAR